MTILLSPMEPAVEAVQPLNTQYCENGLLLFASTSSLMFYRQTLVQVVVAFEGSET